MITALRVRSRGKQISVFVDGSFFLTLLPEIAASAGLEVGQYLSVHQLEELRQTDLFQRCFGAALYFLGYRPRSESEVRQRLHRRGFSGYIVDRVIAVLRERKLIDDLAFAQYWKDNRLLYNQRSRRLMKVELRQKGVATEAVDEALADVDDEVSAYEAATKKVSTLASLNYHEFYRRLYGHLQRRGFDSETVRSVVERLWQERQTA